MPKKSTKPKKKKSKKSTTKLTKKDLLEFFGVKNKSELSSEELKIFNSIMDENALLKNEDIYDAASILSYATAMLPKITMPYDAYVLTPDFRVEHNIASKLNKKTVKQQNLVTNYNITPHLKRLSSSLSKKAKSLFNRQLSSVKSSKSSKSSKSKKKSKRVKL